MLVGVFLGAGKQQQYMRDELTCVWVQGVCYVQAAAVHARASCHVPMGQPSWQVPAAVAGMCTAFTQQESAVGKSFIRLQSGHISAKHHSKVKQQGAYAVSSILHATSLQALIVITEQEAAKGGCCTQHHLNMYYCPVPHD